MTNTIFLNNLLLISRLKVRFLHGPPEKTKGNQTVKVGFPFCFSRLFSVKIDNIVTTFMVAFLVIIFTGCASSNWTFNGVRLDTIKEHPVQTGAGIVAAVAVHTAGHAIYLNSQGLDWHFEGRSEIIVDPMTDDQLQWNGRAGFLAALGVGYAAKLMGADGPFWRGYYTGVVIETLSYPIVIDDYSDIAMIYDGGGNGTLEWSLYSLAAINLVIDRKDE